MKITVHVAGLVGAFGILFLVYFVAFAILFVVYFVAFGILFVVYFVAFAIGEGLGMGKID